MVLLTETQRTNWVNIRASVQHMDLLRGLFQVSSWVSSS